MYKLVDGRLIECGQTQLSSVQATSSTASGVPDKTLHIKQPRMYAEIARKELPTKPASTGLEKSLAKLSTSSSETAQGHEVAKNRKETGGQLAAGTNGVEAVIVQASHKEMPAETRKQKRKAENAATAAKSIQALEATKTTEVAKVFYNIKGLPKNTGMVPKKSSIPLRQNMSKAGQESSHEVKGPGGH